MICYMPLAYLSSQRLQRLLMVTDQVHLVQPPGFQSMDQTPDSEKGGALVCHAPAAVDERQLQNAMLDYQAWANRHQGRNVDLAGFYHALQKAGTPMAEETAPNQLRSQIRNYGKDRRVHLSQPGGPLFQACLFAAMAREYDAYQDALNNELTLVRQTENQMFNNLTGAAYDDEIDMITNGRLAETAQADEAALMTGLRISAWAAMAANTRIAAWAYVTTSRSVLEYLLDHFGNARQLCHLRIFDRKRPQAPGGFIDQAGFLSWLKTQAFTRAPTPLEAAFLESKAPVHGEAAIRLYAAPETTLESALSGLHRHKEAPRASPIEPSALTFIFGRLE